ncbi:hypothetical protein NQZ68_032953 [Dissostichus eleginoides]|nr:hypothetical protein NQZ68_032953 [Dissostichus eleginoides]
MVQDCEAWSAMVSLFELSDCRCRDVVCLSASTETQLLVTSGRACANKSASHRETDPLFGLVNSLFVGDHEVVTRGRPGPEMFAAWHKEKRQQSD